MSSSTEVSTGFEQTLRTHLVECLRGGSAHVDPRTALANVPKALYGAKPEGAQHTLWELLEHLRFTLHDLLVFCTDKEYSAPEWPTDYWPSEPAPIDGAAWQSSVDAFLAELAAFEALAADPSVDLEARIPWGEGQTVLREILLAIDHNSYHLGQVVLVRNLLVDWKG